MRQQVLNEIVELSHSKHPRKEISIKSIKCDSKWQSVFSLANAILDHKINNGLVLLMFGSAFLSSATLNELLNALIDENDRELVFTVGDVELRL